MQGHFEYQTVIPPPYFDPEDSTWRAPHIHVCHLPCLLLLLAHLSRVRARHTQHFVQADGHLSGKQDACCRPRKLRAQHAVVTQIMFPDMPKNDVDNHIRPDITVPLTRSANHWVASVTFALAAK